MGLPFYLAPWTAPLADDGVTWRLDSINDEIRALRPPYTNNELCLIHAVQDFHAIVRIAGEELNASWLDARNWLLTQEPLKTDREIALAWTRGLFDLYWDDPVMLTEYMQPMQAGYLLWWRYLDNPDRLPDARAHLGISEPPPPVDVWEEWVEAEPSEHKTMTEIFDRVLGGEPSG